MGELPRLGARPVDRHGAGDGGAPVGGVDGLDGDLLVLGEMGIGNTTPSAAIAAALAGGETAAWVGRGTGIDDEGLARKRQAVQESVRRIAGITDPLEILREVGGAEIVAITAATVAARHRSMPVVLDGYVVTSAVLPLNEIEPSTLDHCTVGHCSAEPGHRKLLERLLEYLAAPPVVRYARPTG